MENKLYELTRRRRSVRRYGEGHIDDETIREIMKVALTAPTSFGHKPVEFVVVRDREMIKKIGQDARREIEKLTGRKIFLELRVKVMKNWRNDENLLRQLRLITEDK